MKTIIILAASALLNGCMVGGMMYQDATAPYGMEYDFETGGYLIKNGFHAVYDMEGNRTVVKDPEPTREESDHDDKVQRDFDRYRAEENQREIEDWKSRQLPKNAPTK